MIIPVSEQQINIGDIVVNIKLIDYIFYIIPPGHEFKIIQNVKNYGYFIGEDLIHNQKVKLCQNEITKKVDLKIAEKEYIYKTEKYEYERYIRRFCPNGDYEYEDRYQYESCKLIKYPTYCNPKLDCAKYLTQEHINNCKPLVKHLRLNKVKKIEE